MPTKTIRQFVVIPILREKSHHITVVARLASRSARFIVDTGAGLKKAKIKPVVGVLGADVLWSRHAVIDYDRGLMLLST